MFLNYFDGKNFDIYEFLETEKKKLSIGGFLVDCFRQIFNSIQAVNSFPQFLSSMYNKAN